MADRKRARRVCFAAEDEDEDERRGRDAAQRRRSFSQSFVLIIKKKKVNSTPHLIAFLVARALDDDDIQVQKPDDELVLLPLGEWEADACKAVTLRLGMIEIIEIANDG